MLPKSLDVKLASEPVPSAFPNGCHVAEVEIDPETGVVEVVKYTSVNDFGTLRQSDAGRRARCTAASSRASARR